MAVAGRGGLLLDEQRVCMMGNRWARQMVDYTDVHTPLQSESSAELAARQPNVVRSPRRDNSVSSVSVKKTTTKYIT